MNPLGKKFANNLVRLRKSLNGGMTQDEFAEFLKVPKITYQGWEAGKIPRPSTRASIAKALNVAESKLFADPDYVATPKEALNILEKALLINEALTEKDTKKKELIGQIIGRLAPLKNSKIEEILSAIDAVLSPPRSMADDSNEEDQASQDKDKLSSK